MNRTIRNLALLLMAAVSVPASAQPGSFGGQVSPTVVNADGTVTFNYSNRNAGKVQLWTQFSGDRDMVKGPGGIWSVTVGPAVPDIYPYHFTVDGISVMDPQNPDWFPNETFKNSLLDIRADGQLHSLENVPHGSVDYRSYWSEDLGMYIPVIVYTPPFYDSPANKGKRYPVMYMISGTTDTEEVYFKVGKVNFILDNLIAAGRAKEMIVVLPYGNATLLKSERQPASANSGFGGFGAMGGGYNFNRDFTDVLMPFIEKEYRTINDAEHRGIGGFSRGGNQGLSIGLSNLDKFSYLCSYSSFTQVRASQFEDADAVNAKIRLFWLGIGTDDFLYGNSKDLMDMLDRYGIHNIKEFTYDKFGHTWMNARYWLEKSLPLLFQDEDVISAEKGMELAEAEKVRQASEAGGEASRLTPTLMSSLFPAGVKSPEYNSDGSVTFRCQAPDAEKVELECQIFSGNRPMTRNGRGVWEITVTAEKPDIYPYCFVIDGTQVADPNNMHIFPNEGFKYSLADLRGDVPSVQDIQDVPHGKVSYRYYHSGQFGFDRPLCIYTPAGYDPAGREKLPVLYLIHGMTDTYETWFKVGQVNNILDNLIAEGKAERMIIVMPYANPAPEIQARGLDIKYDLMGTDMFCKEILDEVIPFVESNYNVIAKADKRAIAGFSLGGRQTLACGFGNPDKFHWVCAFAPAIFGNEYETNFGNGTYAPIKELKKKLNLMWLGTGSEDFLIQASRGLDSYLTQQGLDHTFYNPTGGHTWMNCRDYIELVAEELFK